MVSAFLLIYYTDVAGISAATAGTLFLVVRIWGGVTDLFAGRRRRRDQRRAGASSGPTCCSARSRCCCCSSRSSPIPERAQRRRQDRLGARHLRAVSLGLQLREHPLRVAVGGDDPGARTSARKLATGRVVGGQPRRSSLIAVVVSPQISGAGDLQRSLTITTIVFAVIGFALYLWCFFTARETVAA